MYKIVLNGITAKYEYDELIKIFFSPDDYVLLCDDENNDSCSLSDIYETIEFNAKDPIDKNLLKVQIYEELSKRTGKKPDWGIHTGVRPVKLAGDLVEKYKSNEKAILTLKDYYHMSKEKSKLVVDIYNYQKILFPLSGRDEVGIYIGIPFCPTRCVYCSFTSNQVEPKEIERYLVALHKEIDFVSQHLKDNQKYPESIYIGGGTPTTLTADQIDRLLSHLESVFDLSHIREFTVEAGRPDTITIDKLKVIKSHSVNRISINPQSMKEKTLRLIGRNHDSDDIRRAFYQAKEIGIPIINADVITGLPEENICDFENTLREIISLGADNVTVHTLAVKRASRLIDIDKDYHYKQGEIVREMLSLSRNMLKECKFLPYYLYRQKHMAGAFENTGYCINDTASIYNIRIMEERQTIVALGAGGISKMYYPEENRLERVPNVSNYEIYIERLNDMIERKKENIFVGGRKC